MVFGSGSADPGAGAGGATTAGGGGAVGAFVLSNPTMVLVFEVVTTAAWEGSAG